MINGLDLGRMIEAHVAALDLLLYFRYAEIFTLLWAIHWVIYSMPPCSYRTKRLLFAFALLAFNIGSILVRVLWLQLPPW